MKSFEIFKSGKVTASSGEQLNFSDADLAAMVAAYDPALHPAPICVGHPKNDAPAYGWVAGLSFKEGVITARPDEVDPAFSEIVQAGRYKTRSASFYPPTHSANPTPGKYYLKHVAFLGAEAPAVKGLKPVSFSGDSEGVVTVDFSESDNLWSLSSALRSMAAMARGFRELLIADKGQEDADRLIANWQIDELVTQSERLAEQAREITPNFSEPELETDVKTQQEIDAAAADLAARETAIATREANAAARDLQFSEGQRATRRTGDEAMLDALIADGRFAPGAKPAALDFMASLEAETTIEFSESDGATKTKKTPHAYFTELLKTGGKIIDFSEVSAGKDAVVVADLTDATVIAAKAVEFQESERQAGRVIDVVTAVAHVTKKA